MSLYVSGHLNPISVQNISVPDDLEVVWGHIRPRRLPREILSIFLAAVYSPANRCNDDKLIDYIIHVIDGLSSKHPFAGFAIMGDFNKVDTDVICSNTSLRQIVDKPTRNDAILDKILTNMRSFYKETEITSPLELSNHNSVMWMPLSSSAMSRDGNVTSTRFVRPMRESDTRDFGNWISNHTWSEVNDAVTASDKCDAFYQTLQSSIDNFFPLKKVRLHQKDRPWIAPDIKSLINKRQKLFGSGLHREWRMCCNTIIRRIKQAKDHFYHDRIAQLKTDDPTAWYISTSPCRCKTRQPDLE